MSPIDVPTQATVAFISAHVGSDASLIEVGCGAGEVARELNARGFRVFALDSDPQAIATAVGNGVPASLANWPEFDCEPVDAVVFTRSLHHMEALAATIQRALELLRPGGVLLAEDFAYDEADSTTVGWFLETLRSPEAHALIDPADNDFVTELLGSSRPLDTWHNNHDHDLHTLDDMTEAIARHFDIPDIQRVPYLYRYMVPVLPDTEEAAEYIAELRREEERLGKAGEIALIGRRMVAASPGN